MIPFLIKLREANPSVISRTVELRNILLCGFYNNCGFHHPGRVNLILYLYIVEYCTTIPASKHLNVYSSLLLLNIVGVIICE